MSSLFKCSFCAKIVPTMKGLRSHMTQHQICRDAMQRVAAQWEPVQHTADESIVPDQSQDDYEMEDGNIPDVDSPQPESDPPQAANSIPSASTDNTEIRDKRARVEAVEDEDDGGIRRWPEDCPSP